MTTETDTGAPPRGARLTFPTGPERRLWLGIGAGVGLIAAWFAATRTTLLLAYGSPAAGVRTLAGAQGICDSTAGEFARILSAQGAARCNAIDHTATTWNAIGFAGLLAAVVCAALIAYQAHRSA